MVIHTVSGLSLEVYWGGDYWLLNSSLASVPIIRLLHFSCGQVHPWQIHWCADLLPVYYHTLCMYFLCTWQNETKTIPGSPGLVSLVFTMPLIFVHPWAFKPVPKDIQQLQSLFASSHSQTFPHTRSRGLLFLRLCCQQTWSLLSQRSTCVLWNHFIWGAVLLHGTGFPSLSFQYSTQVPQIFFMPQETHSLFQASKQNQSLPACLPAFFHKRGGGEGGCSECGLLRI